MASPTLMFPKKRKRGSDAVASNLWVQFCRNERRPRSDDVPGRILVATHLDFGMIWRYTITNESMRRPQSVEKVNSDGWRSAGIRNK